MAITRTKATARPRLNAARRDELLAVLEARFREHPHRHERVRWEDVRRRLLARGERIWSLHEMERTGGEPDVVALDSRTGEIVFHDCSPETPEGRRSLCYDAAALQSRKAHAPGGSAMQMAAAMGVELLTEPEYHRLQELDAFDTRTSSWLRTPPAVRDLGGALFGDRRYGRVFVYHNGAPSYYAVRGFRASLRA